MRLDTSTWEEVDAYLGHSDGAIVPVGSTEQHGPLGIIGTDAICAQAVADGAGELAQALVLPAIAYTPAPFNMAFAGTISVTVPTFRLVLRDILHSLSAHGFRRVFFLNGHGANLEPLRAEARDHPGLAIAIRSWWEFPEVQALRRELYGDWEGMHATPSEVAITRHTHRIVKRDDVLAPARLSPDFIAAHAGDRHGPAEEHRRQFPDGRVGSHSGLAQPEHGEALLALASRACAEEFQRLGV